MQISRKAGKPETMLGSYRILDLTDEKGLMCGQLLGSLGADVIKVERLGGDPARKIGPFVNDSQNPEESLFWFAFNTNKRGITLDIETNDGKNIFKKLVARTDVVIESFTPGYMDSLHLGYSDLEKINRGIVMTSISAFGQKGPYSNYKSSDLVSWALGGALFCCGSLLNDPPTRVSHVPQSCLLASADAAWATMMALCWRRISGEGQYVDVSIQESVERAAFSSHIAWKATKKSYERKDSDYSVLPNRPEAPRSMWACKDGSVACHIFAGELGTNLNTPIIEWMDSEGMADDYIKNIDWTNLEWDNITSEESAKIEGYYERFFSQKTNSEILAGAGKRRAVIQPVYGVKNLLEHPQLKDRGFWQKLEHKELGLNINYPGGFCQPTGTICQQWQRAPRIGEHNLEIYHQELGFSKEQFATLQKMGII